MKPKQLKLIQWLDTGIIWPAVLFTQGFSYTEIHKHFIRKKTPEHWLLALESQKEMIEGPNWCAMKSTVTRGNEKKICFFLCIKGYFDFSDGDYCALAHEVTHLCQYILPDFCKRDNEIEFEAYMHTHLMTQCLKHIRGK